jgi:squalene-hopene/tetraprenyl-beta-curcumene cyclase
MAACVSAAAIAGIVRGQEPGANRAAKAREMIGRAVAYLRSQQDAASGGWAVPPVAEGGEPGAGQPHYPAITALVMIAMLSDPGIQPDDAAVQSGVKYLLNHQRPDGGIYDRVLPSYNTSIALSALAKLDTSKSPPQVVAAISAAQQFLRGLQWSESGVATAGGDEAPHSIVKDHPYYGGVGYGKHGRPDNSNLGVMLQGLHDSGVSPDDAAFQRALTFLQRTQMLGSVNDMPYADGSRQGGFIYATVPNAESVEGRAGQSFAGMIEETLDDGTKISRLRCYGSMTYSGFKSYLYANLSHEDERVKAAFDWIRRNYTVEENPGLGTDGMYYYFVTMSRALAAWGEPTIQAIKPDGTTESRRWADDLIDRLAGLQNADGSFRSVDDRWMENNPVLITAYAGIALGEALRFASTGAQPEGGAAAPPEQKRRGDPYYLSTCAVCAQKLGMKGDTIDRLYDSRELCFCTDECRASFEADPPASTTRIDQVMIKDQLPHYPPGPSIVSGAALAEKPVDVIWNNRLFRLASDAERTVLLKDPERHLKALNESVIKAQTDGYGMTKCPVQGDFLVGDEIEITVVANRMIRLCCKKCVAKDPSQAGAIPGAGGLCQQ